MYKTRYGRVTKKVNYKEFEHEDNPNDQTYVENQLSELKTELKSIRENIKETQMDTTTFILEMISYISKINSLKGSEKFSAMIEMFEYLKKHFDFVLKTSKLKSFRNTLKNKIEEFKSDIKYSSATGIQILSMHKYFDFFLSNL